MSLTRAALITTAACLGLLAPAQAAETQTASYGEIHIENFTSDGRRNNSYQTQITANLNGAVLYDETFFRALGDPISQAGVDAARAIRTYSVNGAPGVITWSDPVLIDSYEEFLDSFTEVSTITLAPVFVTTVQTTSGDAPDNFVYVNERGYCSDAGVSGATNVAPFDGRFAACDNLEEITVAAGDVNTNTHTATIYEIIQASFTNEDYLNFNHYELQGELTLIGTGHAAVQSGLFDLGAGFLDRLAANIESAPQQSPTAFADASGASPIPSQKTPMRLWAEAYGGEAENQSDANVTGNERTIAGLSGGYIVAPAQHWTFGAALDHGAVDINSTGAPEHAELTLTQFAAHAGFHSGRWFANASALYGFGDVETRRGDENLGISTAEYDISLAAIAAQAGYRFNVGGFRLIPALDLDWQRAKTDAFTEQGGIALTAEDNTTERATAAVGLTAAHLWRWDNNMSLDLSARARLISILSGEARTLPVAFAATPDDPLEIIGASEGDSAQELGVSALLGLTKHVALSAAANTTRNDDDEAYRYLAGVRVSW